ncbi:ABC transporter permease subunit [Skermania sp. ID1734]|uniref:ABC transporter permease n=1 Tax=Skermania sp. ID1734 TaxID=2597516 RepID=UPI00117D4500|nr:ABC transporter permease [Skermania sp. ID1734]TSD96643.1 ABC transporter permease subunit [Skermania sp. ID1734]
MSEHPVNLVPTALGIPELPVAAELKVRVEVGRQLRRPIVRAVLVAMAILPLLLSGAVHAGGARGVGASAGIFAAVATDSAANFMVFALDLGTQYGMAIVVALVFGESIAREAQWNYLRVLLTVPVSRGRLLTRKLLAAGVVCLLAMATYVAMSAAIGVLCYGLKPLMPPSGTQVPESQELWRLAVALGYLIIYLAWIGSLGMFMSVVAQDNPVIAAGGTVIVVLCSTIFGGLPTLGGIRAVLPTRNYEAWLALTRTDIDWLGMQWGVFLSLLYAGIFLALSYVRFLVSDVKG